MQKMVRQSYNIFLKFGEKFQILTLIKNATLNKM